MKKDFEKLLIKLKKLEEELLKTNDYDKVLDIKYTMRNISDKYSLTKFERDKLYNYLNSDKITKHVNFLIYKREYSTYVDLHNKLMNLSIKKEIPSYTPVKIKCNDCMYNFNNIYLDGDHIVIEAK